MARCPTASSCLSAASQATGVWKDVTDASDEGSEGQSPLARAEKILGGTTRFIKKKKSP